MKREDVLRLLREHEPELHDLGVAHASLFGSVARDEADDGSDVDLFITPALPRFSLIHLARVKRFLQNLFGRKIDVFTTNGTSRPTMFKDKIKPDLVEVF
jgi:predicted nucleotidyltransferase